VVKGIAAGQVFMADVLKLPEELDIKALSIDEEKARIDEAIDSVKAQIKERMIEIINDDILFVRDEIKTEKALNKFAEFGLDDKCTLLETRVKLFTSVYRLKDTIDYFYGYLVYSTGYLKNFNLVKYHDGMLMVLPCYKNPDSLERIVAQPKLFEIFREYKDWVDILGVPNVGQLNELTLTGKIGDLIKIAEALQEKKLAQIADKIFKVRDKVKLILVSGPSSSGKTTTGNFSKSGRIPITAGTKSNAMSANVRLALPKSM